jgi:hypothetical protein
MTALAFALLLVAFVGVLAALMWLAARVRRRGIGGDAMAVIEQVYRPTAYQSHAEIRQQAEQRGPLPSPEAPPAGGSLAG